MINYETASLTKDYHQLRLLKEFPAIVSIAPQAKLDAYGKPTGEGMIVIGILNDLTPDHRIRKMH
jgi:hypothetical protein